MVSRRSLLFLLLSGTFLGALVLVSRRLGYSCPDGTYCLNFRPQHPPFGHRRPFRPSHSPGEKGNDTSTDPDRGIKEHVDAACANFPDTSNILVVMKTGASEAYSKVPTQIITNLRCIDDFLIFSDMKQEIAGYTIHDSLDTVLPEVQSSNGDFDLYFRQQRCPVDQANCNQHFDVASQGWALDKYKNIHIAEKTYKMRPDYDWYIFVDADSYVVWPTLVEWLKRINPMKPHYIGSVAMLGDFPFGHGGSGYLVSQGAMKRFLRGKENVANRWDNDASQTCCGDYMFAYALKQETNIGVVNAWPTINGEKPSTLEFREEQWCQPIATMHHIGSEEVSDFDAFEQARNFSAPMRVRDIYHQFLEPHLTEVRVDWDNGSQDETFLDPESGKHSEEEIEAAKKDDLTPLEKKAHLSFRDCREACVASNDCFQFRFHNSICGIHRSIKHGEPTKREWNEEERSMSGWDVAKIKAWVKSHDKCGAIQWPDLSG